MSNLTPLQQRVHAAAKAAGVPDALMVAAGHKATCRCENCLIYWTTLPYEEGDGCPFTPNEIADAKAAVKAAQGMTTPLAQDDPEPQPDQPLISDALIQQTCDEFSRLFDNPEVGTQLFFVLEELRNKYERHRKFLEGQLAQTSRERDEARGDAEHWHTAFLTDGDNL